jgi:hypothetical protein
MTIIVRCEMCGSEYNIIGNSLSSNKYVSECPDCGGDICDNCPGCHSSCNQCNCSDCEDEKC